jgi:RNA polymerase sigma-70 factor (ECF subfamily)
MSEAEWGRWMAAAQGGDQIAYRRLLGELRPWLTRYYRRRLFDSSVDDAVQDALVAIHTKRHTYDPARPFGPWIAAIARYKWVDRLRTLARRAEDALPEQETADFAVKDGGDGVVAAVVLQDLLGRLKPAQATVIRLVKIDGLSIEEAAAATGQSESLVKVNIHRGLAKLSAMVEDDAE